MQIKNLVLTAVAASIFAALPAFAKVDNTTISKDILDPKAVDKYWTEERMQTAKELPLPNVNPNQIKRFTHDQFDSQEDAAIDYSDGAPPAYNGLSTPQQLFKPLKQNELKNLPGDRGTAKRDFSSSRLIPLSADKSYPYATVGKLFFTIPGQGNFVCSASVLRPRVVLTAGHCVHRGSGGSEGFFTNWKFVPAFRDGSAPYLTWVASYVIVTNTWATGGGAVPNAADYAMLEMVDQPLGGAVQRIGNVTGYLGYQTVSLTPNHAHLLGYPCNLDSCQKMHQVTAQNGSSVSPNNVEYGSDMRGGSSGGPWVQNFGAYAVGQPTGTNSGLNRVVGITSYGYTNTAVLVQGSSNPDSRFTSILNTICAHKTGNC